MISIITPTNNPQWLPDLYESLLAQTTQEWEWIVVSNGNNKLPPYFDDERIKTFCNNPDTGNIGALKNYAAMKCTGEIIVEVDHDDLLTIDCLEKVARTFKDNPDASMVYSNCIYLDIETGEQTNIYKPYWGWKYSKGKVMDHDVLIPQLPLLEPQNFSRIWFAPNHVRAWRTKDYWKIGGHNKELKVADDHELIIRQYLEGKIVAIDEVLYIQRSHRDSYSHSGTDTNKEIQQLQWANYNQYIYLMAEKWAADNSLMKIDLCGGVNRFKDYTTMDLQNADIIGDLNETWDLEDNSVGVLRAHDAVEHFKDPIHTMNEIWRVCKHGAFVIIDVPSTGGYGAFQDPTHRSYWNKNSWWYYTHPNYRKFIEGAGCICKFQNIRTTEYYPSKWHEDNKILYTSAHLIAIKDGPDFHGENHWRNIHA